MERIRIKKLNKNAVIPVKGSEYSAGMDLYACIDNEIMIKPHTTAKIGTGLAIEIPNGYFGGIVARSGLATKNGLAPANKLGVCDSDYRGEYIVALHNHSNEIQTVKPNERIAQLVVMPYLMFDFIEVDELSNTERGDGGFGHSGRN